MASVADKITVNFGNESVLKRVRTVLTYESEVRGLSLGQTASEMLLEAVDLGAYPAEVRARLDEIQDEARAKAVEKSLKMGADLQKGD